MRLFGRWSKNSNNDSNIPVSELGSSRKRHSKPAIGQKHGCLLHVILSRSCYHPF